MKIFNTFTTALLTVALAAAPAYAQDAGKPKNTQQKQDKKDKKDKKDKGNEDQEQQQGQQVAAADPARVMADEALVALAGWQNKSARRLLEKNRDAFGDTPEFKTAWALLEIQEGAGGDQKLVDDGLGALAEATKNRQTAEPAALYFQGEVLYQQRKNDEAAAAWKAAAERAAEIVKSEPGNPSAQFYRGAALVRQKDFDEAMRALERAEEGGFSTVMVAHQIGFVRLFQQDWQAAKEAFDRGLEADKRYAPLYYWRAMAWEKLGRKDNMLIDLDQYVKLAPDAPEAGKAKAILASVGG